MTVPRRRTVALARPGQDADVSRILQATSSATPATSAGVPALVLTIGLPGSGKSTFARRLAPQIDAIILESDALRRLLFGEPSYSATESRRLFAALHAAARELLTSGRNVIIDATSVKESDRRPAYQISEVTGARLVQLKFSTPEDVIEQRLARRADAPDPADSSSAGLGVYGRMAEHAETPTRDFWEIDTSNAAETEAALSRVVEACRQGAGRAMGGIR
jgi:predicted kinase